MQYNTIPFIINQSISARQYNSLHHQSINQCKTFREKVWRLEFTGCWIGQLSARWKGPSARAAQSQSESPEKLECSVRSWFPRGRRSPWRRSPFRRRRKSAKSSGSESADRREPFWPETLSHSPFGRAKREKTSKSDHRAPQNQSNKLPHPTSHRTIQTKNLGHENLLHLRLITLKSHKNTKSHRKINHFSRWIVAIIDFCVWNSIKKYQDKNNNEIPVGWWPDSVRS